MIDVREANPIWQRLNFPEPKPWPMDGCWAHAYGCQFGCPADNFTRGHACDRLGQPPLGLCDLHQREIVGYLPGA